MGRVSENGSIIGGAFSRLRRNAQESIRAALALLLEDAAGYALGIHDSGHQGHIRNGDNYAWMIVHDGAEVARWVKAASGEYGGADDMLDRIRPTLSPTGWVGVLMAGMQPESYYAVDYEIGIMEEVADLTPDLFRRYFKRRKL